MDEKYHIIPNNDLYEHTDSIYCVCKPKTNGNMIIHNAFDRRELFERNRRLSFSEVIEKWNIIVREKIRATYLRIKLAILLWGK